MEKHFSHFHLDVVQIREQETFLQLILRVEQQAGLLYATQTDI